MLKTFRSLGFIAIFFILIFTMRPYQLVSKMGWLDPWLSMGMGQVFPQTSFPWNYYKESRLFSILYQFLLTNSPTQFYLIIQTLTISLFGLLLYKLLLNFTSKRLWALACSIIGVLNPLLWGDQAGGADYYNLMGNLLVLSGLYTLLIILNRSDLDPIPRLPTLALGMLSYLIAIEVPSGVIVVFIFQLALFLRLVTTNKLSQNKDINRLVRVLAKQFVGALLLLILEILMLIALQQSPTRLISGPKFLLSSILNSSVQESWWRKLDYSDLISKQYLQGFLLYGTLIFLLISFKKSLLRSSFDAGSIYSRFLEPVSKSFIATWLILIILQFTEKSVALTLDYFATPFLVIGLTLVCIHILYLFNHGKVYRQSFLILPFIFYWIPISVPNQFLLTVALIILLFLQKLSLVTPRYMHTVSVLILCTLCINALGISKDSFISAQSSQFKICEDERINFRNWALASSIALDLKWGPRGSNLMSADDEVLDLKIKSPCGEFNDRPITDALLSFSQLGFPGVSTLGAISETTLSQSYPYQYFAQPFNRASKPTVCVINWQLKSHPSETRLTTVTIMGNQISGKLWCPND